MVVKYSRAQRRHDYARLKNKRQYHWGYGHKDEWNGRNANRGMISFMPKDVAGMVADTPAICSCEMCKNERRSAFSDSPLTMQERRREYDLQEGLDEYYATLL